MRKKLVSLITLFAIAVSVCAIPAHARIYTTETEIIGDFVYEKGANVIMGYIGSSDTVEMPSDCVIAAARFITNSSPDVTKVILNSGKTNGCSGLFPNLKEVEYKEGVTEIGKSSFSENSTIEKVIFPSTLKKIDDWAFKECASLKSVSFKEGLENIGTECFAGCTSLSGDIIIPDTVTSMGYGVFSGCGTFDKVHISENASYTKQPNRSGRDMANWFGRYSFEYSYATTTVKEINIPKPVIRDKNCTFSAEEITFDGEMTRNIYELVKYSSWYNDKYIKGKTNKSTGGYKDFIIVDGTLLKYTGTDRNPVIPEGVTLIAEKAFHAVDMDTVTLPSTLETIESNAFYFTTLKEITIPASVKKIDDSAFAHCPLIEKAVFKGMPEEIGIGIFDESVWLGYDYQDNVIFEDKTKTVPEDRIYCNYTLYNLRDFCNYINRIGGYNLKFDDDFIVAPSYYEMFDLLPDDEPITTASPRPRQTDPNPFRTPSPSAAPSETVKPAESIKPEASVKPQPPGEPAETPTPETLTVHGGDAITVSVNEKVIDFPDAKPVIENDRLLVPVRFISEALGAEVHWNDDIKTVTITGDRDIVMTIGEMEYGLNQKTMKMDAAPKIIDERTYVPVRYVAEALGLTVKWEQ